MKYSRSAAAARGYRLSTPEEAQRERADELVLAKDYSQAEVCYLMSLALNRYGTADSCGTRKKLSCLYQLQGRTAEAVVQARAATHQARELMSRVDLALALKNEGSLNFDAGDVAGARRAAEELLGLIKNDSFMPKQHAAGLVLRARCHIKGGEFVLAEADLDKAQGLLNPNASALFTGIKMTLSDLWSTRAELFRRQERLDDAVNAQEKAVEYTRVVARQKRVTVPEVPCALARQLYELGNLLAKLEKPAEARNAFLESSAIRTAWRLRPLGGAD